MFQFTRQATRISSALALTSATWMHSISTAAQCEATDISRFLYKPLRPDPVTKDNIELDTSAPMRDRMTAMIMRIQDEICSDLSKLDGTDFHEDKWERPNHGGLGRTRVLQDGNVFEKGGVNISIVKGKMGQAAIKQMKARGKELALGEDLPYFVCGISLVLHPRHPMAPTMHLNYRYFEVETGAKDEDGNPKTLCWFGGGADLTPAYLFEDDAKHFHAVYKTVLDPHGEQHYPEMKKNCDKYFYIPHRVEHRGVGGIFFDDIEENPEETFQLVRSCANASMDAYIPIVKKRINMVFTEEQKRWQQVRRGRYVEFNVMYDRGTKFGLATPGARIESILMSLPLTCRYEYMNVPAPNSWEEKTLNVIKTPVEWLNLPETTSDLKGFSTGELFQELARRSASVDN